MASASQNMFATLCSCARNADQNFCRITTMTPLLGARRFGENLALVDAVERRAQLRRAAGADHVAAGFLEERELLRAGIERDEVDLHRAFAFAEDLARHFVRRPPVAVLAVG